MEAFFALLAHCVGNSPVTGEFPSQSPVTRSFDAFFALRLNKRDAGDLRRHRAHYDVTVMMCVYLHSKCREISQCLIGHLENVVGSLKGN